MKKGLLLLMFIGISAMGWCQTPLIDSLVRVVAKHTHDTTEITALEKLSTELFRRDVKRATQVIHQQIALAKALHTDFRLSGAYGFLVTKYENEGLLDSSLYYLNLTEAVVKANPKDLRANSNFNNSSGLFYRNRGDFVKAISYFNEAIRFTKLIGDKTFEAGLLLNIGNAYKRIGDITNATVYHLKSLALFDEVKNTRGQSFCYQGLGNDYLSLKKYKEAERYFIKSEKIKEETGDRRGLISTWVSLGGMYLELEKPALALKYSYKALERAREIKMLAEQANALFNIARILKSQGKRDEAMKSYKESLDVSHQIGDSLMVNHVKADIAAMGNDLKKEEQSLLKNINASREKGDKTIAVDGYIKIAGWYADNKDFEKAYKNLMLYQQLEDSVRGSAVQVQFKNLEEQYENDKKEKEIALLKKDQEIQSLALSRHEVVNNSIGIALVSVIIIAFLLINRYRVVSNAKRLVEIERMRNNIARDLHDDIGSTLSSINILSKVAAQEQGGNAQQYLQRIGDQSARIMENMGDMVWSINPHNDSIGQVVIKMREFATEILEPQNIEFTFSEKVNSELVIDTERRKNLFLIFKESINNAAKYSHATLIEISLIQQNNKIAMTVRDNGIGFDESIIKQGNGLRNLRERAREINGTVVLKSTVGKGTEMEFVLPIT